MALNLNTQHLPPYNGYQDVKRIKETTVYTASITIPSEDVGYRGALDIDGRIKQQLYHKLLQSLMDKDVLEIHKEYQGYNNSYLYMAKLNVVPNGNSMGECITKEFMLNGKSYAKDMLTNAIMNTYPEDFI